MPKTRQSYTKTLTVSERILKIKLMLRWTFLLLLFISGVVAKQWALHENEIVQYNHGKKLTRQS